MSCKRKYLITVFVLLFLFCFCIACGFNIFSLRRVVASENVNVETFKMLDGAMLKLSKDKAIRFVSSIDKTEFDGILEQSSEVKVATMITKKSTLDDNGISDDNFTKTTMESLQQSNGDKTVYGEVLFSNEYGNLTSNENNGKYYFYACIFDIKEENTNKSFSARSYLEVDGKIVAYTEFNSENNSRDIANVVVAAIESGDLDINEAEEILGESFYSTVLSCVVDNTKTEQVESMINNLPSIGEINALDGTKIQEAYDAFSSLNVFEKEEIAGMSKLKSVKAKYDASYLVIDDFQSVSAFRVSEISTNVSYIGIEKGNDDVYGNVLVMNFDRGSEEGKYAAVLEFYYEGLEELLENFGYVQFFVFHDYGSMKTLAGNFDGNYTQGYENLRIESGNWSLITVSKSDSGFFGSLIGLNNIGNKNSKVTFKIGGIYGATEESALSTVNSFIKSIGLPCVEDITLDDANSINRAYNAYFALDDKLKAVYDAGVAAGIYVDVSEYKTVYESLLG